MISSESGINSKILTYRDTCYEWLFASFLLKVLSALQELYELQTIDYQLLKVSLVEVLFAANFTSNNYSMFTP